MSNGNPLNTDPINNPYAAASSAAPLGERDEQIHLPEGQTRGMVGQAVVVGVLMVVQGVVDCLAAVIALFYALFMPQMMQQIEQQAAQQGVPNQPQMPENMGMIFAVGGGVIAAGMLLIGLLLIYSGIGVARYRNRVLAIVSLSLGFLTLFTCYCFPTSMALGIYGLIFLFNQPVMNAFRLRSQGYSVTRIQHAFLSLS